MRQGVEVELLLIIGLGHGRRSLATAHAATVIHVARRMLVVVVVWVLLLLTLWHRVHLWAVDTSHGHRVEDD